MSRRLRLHISVRAAFPPAMKTVAPVRSALGYAQSSTSWAADQSGDAALSPHWRLHLEIARLIADTLAEWKSSGHSWCTG